MTKLAPLVTALLLAGAAHADKVAGTTGTGNNYAVNLKKAGKMAFPAGNMVQPVKIQVQYRDAKNVFKGAAKGVAWLRMDLANVPGGQSEKIDLVRRKDGSYSGTLATQVVEPSGFTGPIVRRSTVTFGADAQGAEHWDSDYNKGYLGPTLTQ
jgi:hypothetical protein